MGRGAGSTAVAALLIAVAFAFFIPALLEAVSGVPVGLSPFGGQLDTVLGVFPLIAAVGVILVLMYAMEAIQP